MEMFRRLDNFHRRGCMRVPQLKKPVSFFLFTSPAHFFPFLYLFYKKASAANKIEPPAAKP